MKNLILLLRELEYSSDRELLLSRTADLRKKINDLFLKIKTCENVEEAQDYFAILDILKTLIIKLNFNKGIKISQDLWEFARDFDRIDTDDTQVYLFNKIKSGIYPLLKD